MKTLAIYIDSFVKESGIKSESGLDHFSRPRAKILFKASEGTFFGKKTSLGLIFEKVVLKGLLCEGNIINELSLNFIHSSYLE